MPGEGMHTIVSPVGTEITIPESAEEGASYFTLDQLAEARLYYDENGYTVVRGVIEPATCDAIRTAFARTVKPYPGYIYRQATANPEKNRINEFGFVMNPILNLQSLGQLDFAPLKSLAVKVFASDPIRKIGRALLDEEVKLVQSMYFEGNSETWPHQDSYYLDSEKIGSMAGSWYALEDIDAGAGRFFVVPGSHRLDMVRNGKDFDVAFNHDKYKGLIRKVIAENGLRFEAPALRKGDVLFWHSMTIHGSLRTTRPQFSRNSLTAHYIPQSHRFLQFQSRIKPLNLKQFEGMQFHCPKDMDNLGSRVVLGVETRFPTMFQMTKRLAIKALVR
ncbi:phytanoyl-CoA dioxygenase family protein [Cupriavidus sp. 30B13]|uniref:phytanoyl-CoA dioxygenase family protein n=1 Tax=Cupriavidus sp. 30B13 TaxID=3384241 RepID=UPI003B90A158